MTDVYKICAWLQTINFDQAPMDTITPRHEHLYLLIKTALSKEIKDQKMPFI